MLLDLSMPGMSGDELLRVVKADAALSDLPVIIVSSEEARAKECLSQGAAAYLAKPVKAEQLRATVARVLDEHQDRVRKSRVAAVPVQLGAVELALPLSAIRAVELMPATKLLTTGRSSTQEVVDFHGEPLPVLNLSKALRTAHREPLHERKLVVVESGEQKVALCVDAVRDPEELPRDQVVDRAELLESELLGRALLGIARTERGLLPLVDPLSFFSRTLLRRLGDAISQAATRK